MKLSHNAQNLSLRRNAAIIWKRVIQMAILNNVDMMSTLRRSSPLWAFSMMTLRIVVNCDLVQQAINPTRVCRGVPGQERWTDYPIPPRYRGL